MAITVEMERKQMFMGEMQPSAFFRTAINAETIAVLTNAQLLEVIIEYEKEMNRRNKTS